jgi:hypothetical protein
MTLRASIAMLFAPAFCMFLPLAGFGQTATAALSVVPNSVNFNLGTKGSQTPAPQTVTITNIGGATVSSLTPIITGAQFRVLSGPGLTTLNPGQSTTLMLGFLPPGTSTYTGTLTFTVRPSTTILPTVSLAGTGAADNAHAVAVSPTALGFGNQSVGVQTCSQSVTLYNGGSTSVTVASATTSAPFTVTNFTSQKVIAKGGNYSFGVTYSPTVVGSSGANVTVTFTGSVPTKTVSLTGAGVNTNSSADPKIPLTDMGQNRCYLGSGNNCSQGFRGGLFDGQFDTGCNNPPAMHDAVGRARAALVTPLDTNGAPSSSGKVVMLSVGMSNASYEFYGCSKVPSGGTDCSVCAASPTQYSVMGKFSSLANRNTKLVLLNGAAGQQEASTWTDPNGSNYQRINQCSNYLGPQSGLSPNQVQVVWLKDVDVGPNQGTTDVSLPGTAQSGVPNNTADAYWLEYNLSNMLRALKTNYPNLRQVFLSSRSYGGFVVDQTDPSRLEPFPYESGYGVKWLVKAQVDQMNSATNPSGCMVDVNGGDLNSNVATSGQGTTCTIGLAPTVPWIVWDQLPATTSLAGSTYFWAFEDTSSARNVYTNANGMKWPHSIPTDPTCNPSTKDDDYFIADGQHPNPCGVNQVGTVLINYFSNSRYTSGWFLAH